MDVPTDRLLLMVIVATGFAVAVGGWAAGLVHAEATGLEEWGLRLLIGAVFVIGIVGIWRVFSGIDEERTDE